MAFCQSFSVRSHKGHASYRSSMCAVLGAAQWPTAGTACSGMSPPRLQLIPVLKLHLLTAHAHNSVNHRVRWLPADAQYCPCCTSAWLIPSAFCAPLAWLCRCAATTGNIKVAFCRSLKVQVQFKLATRSMLHGSACASHARGSTLQACRCVQEGSSRGRAGRHFR